MQILSPAKINLSLNVGPAQPSGYHLVDSVFHLTRFGDVITLSDSDSLRLTCTIDLGIRSEQNLAYKAALAMGEEFGRAVCYHIHIDKSIPHGAGLGGGSSNAAAVMRLLAQQWGVTPDDERCLRIGAQLGADVSVFLMKTAASEMTHYGEKLKRSLPSASGVDVVLAMPRGAAVPTPAAYKAFDENPQPTVAQNELIRMLECKSGGVWDVADIIQLGNLLHNNLAPAARAVSPAVGACYEYLIEHKISRGALVSGSGAASFALCASTEDAQVLAADCVQRGMWAVATSLA